MSSQAGSAGIVFIVVACLAAGAGITFLTGEFVHWLPLLAGIIVGLWAVASINRR